ncbi:MAG TPA: hypothetical protein VGH92_08750 [Gaiellaceae bacterium]
MIEVEAGDPVVQSIFGTTDPEAIWAEVQTMCPEAVECFLFEASVGALLGLVVRGGDRVALKVHRTATSERLGAVQQVQEHLWRYGFPCPRPLGVRGRSTLEEWREDGAHRDAHEPDARRALAQLLVRLVTLTRGAGPSVDLPPFFPRPGGPLWPAPHSVLVDFEATAAGAEWIDEIARAARALRDTGNGSIVLAHHDWTAKHVRWAGIKATVVYDWDSMSIDYEPVFVGSAAAHFTWDVDPLPSVDETFMFIADYERARSSPFTREEQSAAGAAAVYGRAYTARCVHALGGDTEPLNLPAYADALLQ